jgi:hypothetical protein
LVQVAEPLAAYCSCTLATPLASEAVAAIALVPEMVVPGLVTETVGGVQSEAAWTVAVAVDVEV